MSSGLRVHHLDCAHVTTMHLGGQPLTCHVLLVETPASGLILVDTGLGTADYVRPAKRLGYTFTWGYARPARDLKLPAIRQIQALGFDPHDVRHIVQTHLDLDHVGGLADFPDATVHVHQTEFRAAMERQGIKAHCRYRTAMWAHSPRWRTYSQEGEPWFGFEAVRSLEGLPEEIFYIPLAGHTMGHCGVVLNTEDGWLLDAGDAYFDPREVHQPDRQCATGVGLFQKVVTTDKRLRFHNQDRLRALIAAHPEIDVFAAHDPTALPSNARVGRSPAASTQVSSR